MKLSFACIIATVVSTLAFVAIFLLSFLIYGKLTAPDAQLASSESTGPKVLFEVETPKPEHELKADKTSPNVKAVPNARIELPVFQPSTQSRPKPSQQSNKQSDSNSASSRPAIPRFNNAAHRKNSVRSSNNMGDIDTSQLISSTTPEITREQFSSTNQDDPAPSFQASATFANQPKERTQQKDVPVSSILNTAPVSIHDLVLPQLANQDDDRSQYFDLGPTPESEFNRRVDKDFEQNDQSSESDKQWLAQLAKDEAATLPHAGLNNPADQHRQMDAVAHNYTEMNEENLFPVQTGIRKSITDLKNELVGSTLDLALEPTIKNLTTKSRNSPTKDVAKHLEEPAASEFQISDTSNAKTGSTGSQESEPAVSAASVDNRKEEQSLSQRHTTASTKSPKASIGDSHRPAGNLPPKPATNERETQKDAQIVTSAKPQIVGWPLPEALLPELEHLEQFELTSAWAKSAQEAFHQLNQIEIGDPASAAWLAHSGRLASQLTTSASEIARWNQEYRQSSVYMTRVAYQMARRIDVWQAAHEIAVSNQAEKPAINGAVIAKQVNNRNVEVHLKNMDPQWKEYLLLDQAEEVFQNPKSSQRSYRNIAQKILARAISSSLTKEQSQYAQNVIGNELAEILRAAASDRIDLGQFLVDLESHHSNPTSGSHKRINEYFQNYYWSRNKLVQELANRLDTHYRNSNLRIEFSQQLINMMIPQEPTSFNEPVKDRILGASVLGHSRITNRIGVKLIPDPNHLSFRLHNDGRVLSKTHAHAKGFTFSNLGNGLVNATKDIAIGNRGISATPTSVRANSQTRLTDIQGQMDGIPVIGNLARRMAQQQQQAQGFQANKIVENKMRSQFQIRIDEEVEANVNKAKSWFLNSVLSPLHAMELEPTVVQLATTEEAAIVRYRLAGLDQNAADQPRPQSQPDSLASFQMHSSAVNNIINRVQINDREFTPGEFMQHLNLLLNRNDLTLPPEQDKQDVRFKFWVRDGIQLDFVDGKVQITLRICKLSVGKQGRWKNLLVTARYSPTAIGKTIDLEFDEEYGLRVKCSKFKLGDQLAVRTIFSTLFKPDFQFDILPPEVANHPAGSNLAISQMVLSDGWLGVSFGETALRRQPSSAMRNTSRGY